MQRQPLPSRERDRSRTTAATAGRPWAAAFNKAASLWALVALLVQGLDEVAASMWADCLRGPAPNWRPIGVQPAWLGAAPPKAGGRGPRIDAGCGLPESPACTGPCTRGFAGWAARGFPAARSAAKRPLVGYNIRYPGLLPACIAFRGFRPARRNAPGNDSPCNPPAPNHLKAAPILRRAPCGAFCAPWDPTAARRPEP